MRSLHTSNKKDRHSTQNSMIPGSYYCLSVETQDQALLSPTKSQTNSTKAEEGNNTLSCLSIAPQHGGSAKKAERKSNTNTSYTILSACSQLIPQMTHLTKPELHSWHIVLV